MTIAESPLFCLCSLPSDQPVGQQKMNPAITTPDLRDLASALLTQTPGWARAGLTAPSARIREQAAAELAQALVARLEGSQGHDARQMALPL